MSLSSLLEPERRWMKAALREAERAFETDEVPVGAVVVKDAQIVGRGHNLVETLRDPTAHAEMIALSAAAEYRNQWRLDGCTMYVTLEPCAMCAGALVLARLERLVYAATDPKAGACESLYEIPRDPRLNHSVQITAGVLAEPAAELLRDFFRRRREMGEK